MTHWSAATPERCVVEIRRSEKTAIEWRLTVANTNFFVYILRCSDSTYYTGIAADVGRRIAEHESSTKGAKYLKGRGPLTLVFSEPVGDRATASRLEYRIKQLDRARKEALINGRVRLQDLVTDQVSVAG